MAVLTGLVGPLWDAVNPFRALDALVRRVLPAASSAAGEDRLAHLGVWPAVGQILVFGLLDVTGLSTGQPLGVGVLALAYTLFTAWGVRRFRAPPRLRHPRILRAPLRPPRRV